MGLGVSIGGMPSSTTTAKGMHMTAGLRRLLMAVIEEYETETGYAVHIEQSPDGTVTWTDITPDGTQDITVIPAEDDTPADTRVATTPTPGITAGGTADE